MVEDKLDEYSKRTVSDIEKYGLQVMHVFSNQSKPRFSYSIGLFQSYKHPEIIIIGLKEELSHILVNNMAEDIKNGKIYTPLNYYSDILDDFDCYIVRVSHSNYDEYMGQAQRYYKGDDFPLIQCIYPTVTGVFPWEKDWPENIKDLQPILGQVSIG